MQAQTMIDLTVEFTRIPLLTVLEKTLNGSPAQSAPSLDAGTFHKVTGRTGSLNGRHNYSAALEEQLQQLYSPGRESCSKNGPNPERIRRVNLLRKFHSQNALRRTPGS